MGLASLMLAGCSTTEPLPYCCYQGEAVNAYLADLYFESDSGERRGYQEVFPGLAPDDSLFTLPLAFDEADIDLVIYSTLIEVLPQYDANEDRQIQPPELTVLYLVEGARGLGQPVDRIGVEWTVRAVNLSQAERGGLVRYVEAGRDRMNPRGQAVFLELEMLGRDLTTESDGPDFEDDVQIFD